VVDCHTREALSLRPRANFRAFQVVEALDALVRLRGRPRSLPVDNVLRSERGRLADAQGLGRSRGKLSTKIHLTCDALGNPVRWLDGPG